MNQGTGKGHLENMDKIVEKMSHRHRIKKVQDRAA